MTITAKNDTFTYKSGRGDNDTVRPADLVGAVAVGSDGAVIDTTLPAEVVGSVAHDAVDSGKPVKIGGIAYANNTTPTAVVDGDRVNGVFDLKGAQWVTFGRDATPADGVVNANSALSWQVSGGNTRVGAGVFPYGFNGTTWDRVRMNTVANGGAALNELGPYSLGRVTADGQVKGSAGFIHTISIAPLTATPTAGLLTVYNSLTETGTVVYAEWIFATTPGHTVTLDIPCGTGIYVGFDGTLANVQVTVAYR